MRAVPRFCFNWLPLASQPFPPPTIAVVAAPPEVFGRTAEQRTPLLLQPVRVPDYTGQPRFVPSAANPGPGGRLTQLPAPIAWTLVSREFSCFSPLKLGQQSPGGGDAPTDRYPVARAAYVLHKPPRFDRRRAQFKTTKTPTHFNLRSPRCTTHTPLGVHFSWVGAVLGQDPPYSKHTLIHCAEATGAFKSEPFARDKGLVPLEPALFCTFLDRIKS